MNREFWLDGFNFFHHWDSTRGLLRPDSGYDIVRAMDRSLRILGRHLGNKAGWTVVFMDGGLSRHETRTAGLRVRYCGPGRKADDRMTGDLGDLGANSRLVTAITNDRELKGTLRAFGASCMGVSEFLSLVEGKKPQNRPGKKGGKKTAPRPERDDVLRQKCRNLSASEVDAWLEYFGGEAFDPGEEGEA